MKTILLAIVVTFFFSGCDWFGSPELYKSEPGRTTYRAVDESLPDAEVTPVPQKIPGESR